MMSVITSKKASKQQMLSYRTFLSELAFYCTVLYCCPLANADTILKNQILQDRPMTYDPAPASEKDYLEHHSNKAEYHRKKSAELGALAETHPNGSPLRNRANEAKQAHEEAERIHRGVLKSPELKIHGFNGNASIRGNRADYKSLKAKEAELKYYQHKKTGRSQTELQSLD